MTPTVVASSAPLAVLAACGVVSVLVVDEPDVECPECMGEPVWVTNEHCLTVWPECSSGDYDPRCCRFPKSCSCTEPRCSTCRGSGRVSLLGPVQIATPDTEFDCQLCPVGCSDKETPE